MLIPLADAKKREEEGEDADDDDDGPSSRLVAQLLAFLLKGFQAKNKIARFRCVQLVALMVNSLGEIECAAPSRRVLFGPTRSPPLLQRRLVPTPQGSPPRPRTRQGGHRSDAGRRRPLQAPGRRRRRFLLVFLIRRRLGRRVESLQHQRLAEGLHRPRRRPHPRPRRVRPSLCLLF